jgi:hypothetical protein
MLIETDTRTRPAVSFAAIASLIDRRPYLVLPIWIAAYFVVLWRVAHRPLWYDELFTYYVSMAPTWKSFVADIRFVDLNPPLSYFFVRSSITLFGDSPFSTRLPSLLAFLIASLVPSHLMARRFGGAFGLIALGVFWSSTLTAYAVEARPYALLLAFFSISLWCWLNSIGTSRWTKWHTGLAAANVAMMLTHCFAPILIAAIGAGELVRSVETRRIDRRVWVTVIAPLSLVLFYVPLVRNAQALIYPAQFEATALTIPAFYLRLTVLLLPAICTIPLLRFLGKERQPVRWLDLLRPHEGAFCAAALLGPIAIIVYSIWSGVPFWDRYAVGAILGASILITALCVFAARRGTGRGIAGAVIILVLFCFLNGRTGVLLERYENSSAGYRAIQPDLPFVTASGLTFLEMDHRESPEFIRRLYYLTDRESAIRYAHASIFEELPRVARYFPVRGNITPYREFIKQNPQFIVLGTPGFPEDWLLEKLHDDGAEIHLVLNQKNGYRDRQLFQVRVRRNEVGITTKPYR